MGSPAALVTLLWQKAEIFQDFLQTQELTKPLRIFIDWLMLTESGSSSKPLHYAQNALKDNLLTRRIIRFPGELIESFTFALDIIKEEKDFISRCRRVSDLFFEHILIHIKTLCHIAKGCINVCHFLKPYENNICKIVSLIGLTLTYRKLYQNTDGWLSYLSFSHVEKIQKNSEEVFNTNLYFLFSLTGNFNNLIRKNFSCNPLTLVAMSTAHFVIGVIKFIWERQHNKPPNQLPITSAYFGYDTLFQV